MPAPRMRNRVKLVNPGPPVVDPETGNPRPGAPQEAVTRALLSQRPVADIGSQIELLANQQTTISLWTIVVPPRQPLYSTTRVIDLDTGDAFEVAGEPADRPHHRPQFRAAALRLISDMQA